MTYVCVQNIKPCEFATQLEEEPWRQAKPKLKWTQGTHTPDTKTHFWESYVGYKGLCGGMKKDVLDVEYLGVWGMI